jgi:hypothetical protein
MLSQEMAMILRSELYRTALNLLQPLPEAVINEMVIAFACSAKRAHSRQCLESTAGTR